MHSYQKLTRPDTPRAFVSGRYSYVNEEVQAQEETAPKPITRGSRPPQETRR
jgi:hypothetical protein